jgi:hypothetical protein
MRTYRCIWNVVTGSVCAVLLAAAVVVLPVALWIVLACLVVPFGLMLAIATGVAEGSRVRWLHVLKLAITAYLTIVAGAVLLKLLGFAAFGVLGLLLVASPCTIGWYGGRLAGGRDGPMPQATVSTDQLCREWLASYAALHSAPTNEARLRVVMARQRCLDELERRDPVGLHAWLASSASAGSNPHRFLTDSDEGPQR